MDIQELTSIETLEMVESNSNIVDIKKIATQLNITYSGNSGIDSLKKRIIFLLEDRINNSDDSENSKDLEPNLESSDNVDDTDDIVDIIEIDNIEDNTDNEIQVAKVPNNKDTAEVDFTKMDANLEKDPVIRRKIVRAKAMKLHRVRITNLNPDDAPLSGSIVTVVNKYLGKVSKYIPFGEESENGYHIPEILLNHLKSQKFALRKEVKNSKFGIKKYKTTLVNKYSIETLDPLTPEELAGLKLKQQSS